MRIVAGSLSGRNFEAPRGHRTHPMSERVRGALFNALGDISGLTVLDPFAGSGALGFEAISRGAREALLIDSDPSAQKTISRNISDLGLRNIKLVKAGANAWLETTSDQFDLVLIDPPYDDLQLNLLDKLAARTVPGGVVVLSLPPDTGFQLPDDAYELLTEKSYGDATLNFYRKI